MAGANMFLMYADGNGNITVSPRLAKGEVEPNYNSDAKVSVLAGSGISDQGEMIANLRCDSCLQWDGGSMDPTDSSSSWIWAVKGGNAIDSTDTSAQLDQHDAMGTFNLDLTQGTGGNSLNPFVTTSGGSGGSTGSSAAGSSPTNSGAASPSGTATTGGVTVPTGVSGGSSTFPSSSSPTDTTRAAHAAIMSLVFLIFFPLFALTLYLPYANRVRLVHAPLQLLSIVLLIVGLALGVKLGNRLDELDAYHQIIGYIVVAALVLFQPALGIYQHLYYHRTGGRSAMGVFHKWLGRTVICVGVVNGGLGFRQAGGAGSTNVPNYAVILYSIIAVVVFLIYLAVVFISKRRANRNAVSGEKFGGRAGYEMHPSSNDRERNRVPAQGQYQNYNQGGVGGNQIYSKAGFR